MDNLDAEWTVESTDLQEFKSDYIEEVEEDENTEINANSPDLSAESGDEKSDDNNSKNDLQSDLNKLKNVALAKKRLQAYSKKAHVKSTLVKQEKIEENDEADKKIPKKLKKDYPDDRAKAVIQEIEELKRKEGNIHGIKTQPINSEIVSRDVVEAAMKNIKNLAKLTREKSESPSSDRDRQFKKREIKSRNYRRTDSYTRRSNSPEDRSRRNRRSSSVKKNYPKNWLEYNEEKLTSQKDEELKAKFFNQKTNSNSELYYKLYNVDGPSPILTPFKYSSETEIREIPFSHIRITRSHPKIPYSANFQAIKESFISRLQLFQMVPSPRRQIIEKLINSAGKCHSPAKPLQTRNWYSKTWKKKEAECKVLENSVGLSFLQNYSDEEEEVDNEEIVICSSTKTNKKKEEPNMTISDIKEIQEKNEAKDEFIEEESQEDLELNKTNEEQKINDESTMEETFDSKLEEDVYKCEPGEIVDDSQDFDEEDREYTPEKELLLPKLMKEEEILKTRQAIKMLEKQLAKRNEMSLVEVHEKKEKSRSRKESEISDKDDRREEKKKKKKKSGKLTEHKDQSINEDHKNSKNKKKKKKKSKKREVSEEEETSEEEEKKTKKAKIKEKKKDKVKNKNSKKESSSKESKTKSRDDTSEEETKFESKKKKKKKIAESVNQKNDKESKKNKKKKIKKKRDSSEETSSSDEEDEKPIKKDKNEKKLKKIKNEKISSKTIAVNPTMLEEVKRRKRDDIRKSENNRQEGCESPMVEYTDLRQKLVAKSSKMKEDKTIEEYLTKRKISENSTSYRNDLRWELLENKRKRKGEELEDFPLEKDTFNSPAKNIEAKTPDTDEYSGNWEKESDAVWESEEDLPPKPKEKSNSWESDEETFERTRSNTEIRSFKDSLDLEIPLNIKPFKRRPEPIINTENLNIDSKHLSEERRRLEIEKLKVKELEDLERRVIQQLGKDQSSIKRQSLDDLEATSTSNKDDVIKKTINAVIDLDKIQDKGQMEISKPKRDRWDQRIAACSTPIKSVVDLTANTPERSEEVLQISSSSEAQDTSTVLENEYEQFIKAVSSNEKEEKPVTDEPTKLDISPKDIPFIPMPNEKTPVPVPSPKVDVDSIANSINISLSTNITLGFSSPSHRSLNLINAPLETPIPKTEAVVSSSTVDIKPQVVKNENTDTGKLPHMKFELPNVDFQMDSPLRQKNAKEIDETEANKPLIFGGMTLPSKRALLDNSNLKLGDSDEEDNDNKTIKIKPFEDIKKEPNKFDVETTIQEPVAQQMEEHKPVACDKKEVGSDQAQKRARSRSPRYMESKQAKREKSPKRTSRYSPARSRRNESPGRRRSSPARRHGSPRRSPRRRSPSRRSPERKSPIRNRWSPGRKSPSRRSPTGKRRYSSRRSNSPGHRRRRSSISPRRRSPRRSDSPRASSSKRMRSRSPEKSLTSWKSPEPDKNSRVSVASPLERLKRSVADSTISDDLLPQPSHNHEEYIDSPSSAFYDRSLKRPDVSMRPRLEVDYMKDAQKIITHTSYNSYNYDQNSPFTDLEQYMNPVKQELNVFQQSKMTTSKNSFVQVGNMVQIVPSDLNIKTEHEEHNVAQRSKTVTHKEKSQMVQVGNIVQIVPTEFSPEMLKPLQLNLSTPPPPSEPSASSMSTLSPKLPSVPTILPLKSQVLSVPQLKLLTPPVYPPLPQEVKEEPVKTPAQEKQSAEETMQVKIAERKAEREQRRQEKEKKRLEKEKRRKEREMKRQIKMKQKTENMIKRALQLEVAAMAEGEASVEETSQWTPNVSLTTKDVGKSILMKGGFSSTNSTKADKVVKFADGVRPGEGTSPSGGEELSSPPPKKILPKEKRYTKTKLKDKAHKKKVKVKIVKKSSTLPTTSELDADDDEDDNLPPPSPPPGSPPPHLFPPRIKPPILNNIHPSFVMAVQPPPLPPPVPAASTSQQPNPFAAPPQLQLHPQPQLYNPGVSLLMAPPPPPPHHHAGPPATPLLHHPPMPIPPHHGPPMPPPHHASHPPPGLTVPHHAPPPLTGPPPLPHRPYHF